MPRFTEAHKIDLIEKAARVATRRLGNETAAGFVPFLNRYFAHVPPQDVYEESPDDLFGAAFCHWRLAGRRRRGEAVVRVYNPRLDEDGWKCRHTIAEIVTDNMPFLVDSVSAQLARNDLTVRVAIHPVFRLHRDETGVLLGVADGDRADDGVLAESFMHFRFTHQSGDLLEQTAAAIRSVLGDVRAAVDDWQTMRSRLEDIIGSLEADAPGWPADEMAEIRDFLNWLHDNHFTFLGYREYTREASADLGTIALVPGSGLGVLRNPEVFVFAEANQPHLLSRAIRAFIAQSQLLVLTKTDKKATVHRPVPMDAVAVKRFDGEGRVIGHRMFVGLFTAAAYTRSPAGIPVLRRKLQNVVKRAKFDPAGHDGKALLNILETFPRDELFQIGDEQLFRTALGILHLQERQRVALFVRRDDYDRYVTCLIYVPSDRYDTQLRMTIQSILERRFAGTVMSQHAEVGDSPLARLYVIIRTISAQIPEYEQSELEAEIAAAVRTWSDHLRDALIGAHGEEEGHRLYRHYGEAFPPAYQDLFNAEEAVTDINRIEAALAAGELGMILYRPFDSAREGMRLKLYHLDDPVVLSHALPMLEHLGLRVVDEIPFAIRLGSAGGRMMMIHDFGLESKSDSPIDLGRVRERFQETLLEVWRGNAESDPFNSLVLDAGLTCREVVVIRAYARYLRQVGIPFSQSYMQEALIRNADLARRIVDLFLAYFDPIAPEGAEQRAAPIREALVSDLDKVVSADEDRILRRFLNAVEATLRTNYFQRGADGLAKAYLSLKLDSRKLDDLPLPQPMVEVFVYSPRMEGIHLRGGKVARGGIRWSDRREDFRTEILGLMKAQMVKNVVIVPVGSKGGFVVKRPVDAGDREAVQREGIECYKTLIRGILDVTDNLVGGEVVFPRDVVSRDDVDPYLVVAADKGTATFSDIANGMSKEYGFWLGDAFASGGSNGYDHKKMGITARGAWESVKRHFRELGKNIQEEDFTVIGVGDMSGDVFGNGMLLSPHVRLIAAFNHQHIFVDPDPDPTTSFVERQRLFRLSRSAWADYDRGILSPGGEIFNRSSKTLTLTPEIRARFGIDANRVSPNELLVAILRAEVELLWFGGIGTFVKSSRESHADVGDRSNDAVRVDARQLRCKVIGEGANLGVTQLGRVEFARAGGRLNTDFIDNSAGVDCSDHEVNIKILLDALVAGGDMTEKQRNKLLAHMTDEVAELVLRDNYLQTQAITLIESERVDAFDNQVRLMRVLERQGLLNRAVEFLPDDEELTERAATHEGLTRPEIAVLLAYCKIWLYDAVLASDLPDDRHLAEDVVRYFPSAVQKRLRSRIPQHRLRRELIATSITNSLINRVGGTFLTEIADKTGMPIVDIARAYIISRDVFRLRDVWEEIEALDSKVPASVQTTLHREARRLVERGTLWFLRHGGSPIDITANVSAFRQPVSALAARIDQVLPEELNAQVLQLAEPYRKAGVPEALARRIAYLAVMPSACDIVRIAAARGVAADEIARLYFAVGEFLGIRWLRHQAESFATFGLWQKLAVAAILDELYAYQAQLTVRVLDIAGGAADGALAAWAKTCGTGIERVEALLGELEGAKPLDVSMLTVASRQLGALVAA
jgi:glutamate dehydrogenase